MLDFFTYPGPASFFSFRSSARDLRAALGMVSKEPSRRVNSLALFFVPFVLKGHIDLDIRKRD